MVIEKVRPTMAFVTPETNPLPPKNKQKQNKQNKINKPTNNNRIGKVFIYKKPLVLTIFKIYIKQYKV